MSFTDQKPRIATEEDCNGNWGGNKNGERFRCFLCGYKFVIGDMWRFVAATHKGYFNFLTCKDCDGSDVLERWVKHNETAAKIYWWIYNDVD